MHAAEQAASDQPGAPGWRLALAQAPLAWPPGAERAHPLAPLDAALLAWLAIEGATPRVHMATLLWPEADSESARNSLRQRLFKLKRQLGVALVDGSTVLQLAPGLAHDLADADGVLSEQQAPLGAKFDQWLAQQRERRQGRLRQGLVDLCEMAETARDWPDALTHAQALLELAPLSEEAHRRLIRLHYLAGDRAAALLAFDLCEQRLKHDVGTRPSAETLALLATVESNQADEPGASTWTGRVPAAVQRPPRLIGRGVEWAALQAAWAAGHTVLITGQGGLGKTRLAADFAQSQGRVVMASARPGDSGVAHASLVRWLRALPRQAWVDLPGHVQRELGRLLPEVAPATDTDTSPADPDRLSNAVAALLARAAPDVQGAVFDDLHFADEASLDLMHYLVPASGWRWVLTARAEELSPAGHRLVSSLGA
ncbi:MAG: AfsR family transcriptional regulator, partial [Burkholderiales bacterium PBB5]